MKLIDVYKKVSCQTSEINCCDYKRGWEQLQPYKKLEKR